MASITSTQVLKDFAGGDFVRLEESGAIEAPGTGEGKVVDASRKMTLSSCEESATILPVKDAQEDQHPEWEVMPEIPYPWRPLPLFVVRNIPLSEELKDDDVKRVVESVIPLKVKSVTFDRLNDVVSKKRVALVRLQPLPVSSKGEGQTGLNELASVEGDKSVSAQPPNDGDTSAYATWAVKMLKSHSPALSLGGEVLEFGMTSLQTQLYVGNLTSDWQNDDKFAEAMASHGQLERAFVMRNAEGKSKGYGFVEFSTPKSALACKQAMDEIERSMRPDPRKGKERTNPAVAAGNSKQPDANGIAEAPGRLVKLLRAEWASLRNMDALFSKVLYVANLRTHKGSQDQLRKLFEAYGKIAEVTVPINKTTNSTKGFAFVAFTNGLAADRAYRALEDSKTKEIAGALVSFANPAKHPDPQPRGSLKQDSASQATTPRLSAGRSSAQATGAGQSGPGRGLPDRGMGRGAVDPALRQQLHIQAGLAAQTQMARQMEMRMQHQMRLQQAQMQAQMQAQLRQAQLQFQQQAQQLQRQAAQAQAKAVAEAEARRHLEEEARKAAARDAAAKRSQAASYGYGGLEAMSRGTAYGGQAGYAGGPSQPKHSSTPPSMRTDLQGHNTSGSASFTKGFGGQAGHGYYGGTGAAQENYSDVYGGSQAYEGYGSEYDGSAKYGNAERSKYAQPGYNHDVMSQSAYGYNADRSGYGQGDAHPGGSYLGSEDFPAYSQGGTTYEADYSGGYEHHGSYPEYEQQEASAGQKRGSTYQQASYGSSFNNYGLPGGDYSKRQRF